MGANEKYRDEYFLLIDKLEEIDYALEGKCNDIDCNKYVYRKLFKIKYKPTLGHNFSCMKSLRCNKGAIMRLLSMKKFRKYRYKKCEVCKSLVDTLSKEYDLISFAHPLENGNVEWNGFKVHKKCSKKVKTPSGWNKEF